MKSSIEGRKVYHLRPKNIASGVPKYFSWNLKSKGIKSIRYVAQPIWLDSAQSRLNRLHCLAGVFYALSSRNSVKIYSEPFSFTHLHNTQGFLTPDSFHSTSLATWGSSWGSKEAKFIKEFDFLGFSRCFSARIEKSSKMSKIEPNCVILGWFFEDC